MSPHKPTFGSRHVLVHQVCQGLHADTVHCGIDVEYERSLVKNIGRVVLGETPGGFSGSGAGRLLGITFVERFQPLPDY